MFRRTFLLAFILFVITWIIGLLVSNPTDDLRAINEHPRMIELFLHNAWGAFVMMFGIFTFGILTFGMLLFNAFIFGNVMGVHALTVGWGSALIAIVPHGLFEIPGILCAAAVGFHGTLMIFHSLRSSFLGWRVYLRSIVRYALLSLIFLFVASIIEAYLTPIFL